MVKKRPFVVTNLPPNSSHDFTLNREEWEWAVFRDATSFTVILFLNNGRWRVDFESLSIALMSARRVKRRLVYAITPQGRSVLLPEEKWDEYLKDWETRQQCTE